MAGNVRKYLSYVVLIGFIACVVVVILTKILVTPERVRNALVPVVEKYLHCKVNLKSIDVSLYSGVSLTDLELLSSDDQGMLLAADKVIMRYQFWPLLNQRIVIDEISLERPRVNIERFVNGEINLQQFAKLENETHTTNESADNKADDIDVIITKIFVNQGEVLFKDYSFAAVPHRYKISDLGLNISDFSLNRDFDIKVWGKINGDPVDVDGIVNLKQSSYDMQVNVSHLDMVQFQPYYTQALNGHLDSLKFNIDGRIWGNNTKINSKARIDLQQLDITLTSSARYPLRAADLGINYSVDYDRSTDRLNVDKLQIDVDDIVITCQGAISNLLAARAVDVQVVAKKLPLRSVMKLVPPDFTRFLAGYDLAGNLGLKMLLNGAVDAGPALLSSATISLDAVQVSVADMRPALSGLLEITGKKLHSKQLELTVGDNHMNLELSCDNWAANRLGFRLQLAADKFITSGLVSSNGADLVQMHQDNASTRGYTHASAAQVISEPQALKLPLNVGGDIVIKQARIDSFDLSDIRLHYKLKDNVFEYDRLSCQLANGFCTASGQVDLSRQGFAYSGHVDMQKIDLSKLLPQLDTTYVDSMSGLLATTFDYAGAGTLRLRIQQNLSAAGTFDIADGQMSSNAMLQELAGLLETTELNVFSFSDGAGSFDLATGGHLQYAAEFNGSKARIVPVGSWSMDGTIKSDLDVYLAPKVRDKLVDNAKVTNYLQDENGWGFIPLMVSGKLSSPRLQINVTKVKDSAIERGVEQLSVKINKKLGGDFSKAAPAVQLIESTLKGFLAK